MVRYLRSLVIEEIVHKGAALSQFLREKRRIEVRPPVDDCPQLGFVDRIHAGIIALRVGKHQPFLVL